MSPYCAALEHNSDRLSRITASYLTVSFPLLSATFGFSASPNR